MGNKINPKVSKAVAQTLECKRAKELVSLLLWLQWLDTLIGQEIKMIPTVYGVEATQDTFRGLHISPNEAHAL